MLPTISKKPADVAAERGEVLLDGDDGLAASFTPDAAEETGRRMVDAAGVARAQIAQGEAEGSPADPSPRNETG